MAKCKVGDTVALNSGGPKMTVVSVDGDEDVITCFWFTAGDELRRDSFPRQAVTKLRKGLEE